MGVYKRGKFYYMDFKLPDGRRIYRSTGKKTKAEALIEEEKTKTNLEWELLAPPSEKRKVFSFSKAVERLWDERWSKTKRGGELEKARLELAVSIIGDKPLADITVEDIEKLKKHLRKLKKSETTISRYLAHLRCLFRSAWLKWGVLDKMPYIEIPKPKAYRTEVLTEEEEDRLIQYLRDNGKDLLADLYVVLLDTGMRFGEATAITPKEVDFTLRVIDLHPEIVKTGRPRSVPMTTRVYKTLKSRARWGRIFPTNRWTAVRTLKAAAKACGINEKVVVHSLRHTCASRMVRKGVDLHTVAKILGHSSISVTQRYAHLATTQLRNAINVLER